MDFKQLGKKDFKTLMGTKNGFEINQNHLMLYFIDFDFNPDLITEKLGLEPHSIGRKGEKYFIGPHKKIEKIRDCSHWEFKWKNNSNDFIGDMIDLFFKEIIIPRKSLIKEIGENCQMIRLTIIQYYYTGHNPGYGFNREQVKVLADINADIDMDIYCLCEDK